MSELFNVVFSGQIAGRADPAVVRANLGRMFNASEAVLDRLFSGQPVAVKKMVDRATAMKIRALMKQAGADAQMVAVDAQGRPLAAASPAPSVAPSGGAAAPPVSSPQSVAPQSGSMAARVAELAEQQAKAEAARPRADAPPPPAVIERVETWAIYPVGAILGAVVTRPAPLLPDISRLSMAATGSMLVQPGEIQQAAPVQVDVSALSMAPAGSDVLTDAERPAVKAVQVDISAISMAEVGAPLDEIRAEKPPVNVDISHLKLQ